MFFRIPFEKYTSKHTSLTTMGLSLISFGKAAITSFFVRPLRTGIRNLTSETLVLYNSLTLATNSLLGAAVKDVRIISKFN